MSDFGDFEPGDAVDTALPDPEALARFFYAERHRLAPAKSRAARFDDEPELVRILMLFVFAGLIDKLVHEWQKAPL
jgi:hypothetical protein